MKSLIQNQIKCTQHTCLNMFVFGLEAAGPLIDEDRHYVI